MPDFSDKELLAKIPVEAWGQIEAWLGDAGKAFFQEMYDTHGDVSPVYKEEGGFPHPVHLREGMQVRNFLRCIDHFKDWDAHQLDNNWVAIIEKIVLKKDIFQKP